MKSLKAAGGALSATALPPLGAAYIRLVRRTTRWEWIGRPVIDAVVTSRQPHILAFWHGRILMMAPVMRESALPVHVVISNNRDGELIARAIRSFGGRAIRGSTKHGRKSRDKGGEAAMRAALDRLRAGEMVALTPDGPRGPRMRAQGGAAVMAARTGIPVVPFAWATRSARVLGSWDRFMVPFPFGRGVYVVGEPIPPVGTDEAAVEAHRLAIEDGLNAVTRRADEAAGREPVLPA